jgi:hypothetical protein
MAVQFYTFLRKMNCRYQVISVQNVGLRNGNYRSPRTVHVSIEENHIHGRRV